LISQKTRTPFPYAAEQGSKSDEQGDKIEDQGNNSTEQRRADSSNWNVAMPFLQFVNGKYRVRIVVPSELRPYLSPPHTCKANLTRALGTGNEREANRLAVAWIADFQTAITRAASITENPDGYDWITRYRA
jgi:hypothetical protein